MIIITLTDKLTAFVDSIVCSGFTDESTFSLDVPYCFDLWVCDLRQL